MEFNPTKCVHLHSYDKEKDYIKPCYQIYVSKASEINQPSTYIGITIDDHLTWKEHINEVAFLRQNLLGALDQLKQIFIHL